jgi:hypothetical protein
LGSATEKHKAQRAIHRLGQGIPITLIVAVHKQVVKQKENEFPFHKRPVDAFQLMHNPSLHVIQIAGLEKASANEEEAGHVEHVNKVMQIGGAPTMAYYHEQDTQPLRYVKGRISFYGHSCKLLAIYRRKINT